MPGRLQGGRPDSTGINHGGSDPISRLDMVNPPSRGQGQLRGDACWAVQKEGEGRTGPGGQ